MKEKPTKPSVRDETPEPELKPRRRLWPRTRKQLAFFLAGVVSVVLLVSLALAGPIRRRRVHDNSFRALSEVRKLMTAQAIYRESDRNRDGVFDYGSLTKLGEAGLIDAELASGVKGGYRFVVVPGTDGSSNTEYVWWMAAEPLVPGETGEMYFFANQSTGYLSYDAPIRPKPDSYNQPTHGRHICR